jgi:hypothetical protein
VSAPAPAGLAEPAEAKAAPAFAAPAPIAPGEPARSLDSLSAAKRKLLAKRIRGEAGSGGPAAATERPPSTPEVPQRSGEAPGTRVLPEPPD